ncbi:MAG: hypothetical protein ABR599_00790 [Gemmatimonadota bacterium]
MPAPGGLLPRGPDREHPGRRPARRPGRDPHLTAAGDPRPLAGGAGLAATSLLVVLPVLALKLLLARQLPGPWLFSEATVYAGQAEAIATEGLAAVRGGAREYTILYPLLLAPAFALESRAAAHQAALVVNAVVSTSALLPILWIARRTLGSGLAVAVTALVALLPSVFVYALALSSENLFVPLFWWGTFLLLRLAERDGAADATAAGLVLGLLPAVKLAGFAVVAAAAVMVAGMALFHRIGSRRAAVFLVALATPQVLWLLARALLASPERGLFGFGPGVGEALVERLTTLDRAWWIGLLRFFVDETTYFVTGAYVAWIAFSVYLVSQYRTWRARSVEGFLLLWTFLSAAALAVVTVAFLYPIAQSLTDPLQLGRALYGRFIEVLFPAFFVLGTRGMLDFAWKERAARAPGRELALVLGVAVVTAISFYPLTRYAVSSPFRPYGLAWIEGLPGGVETLLPLLLALPLAGLALVLLRRPDRRGAALAVALAGVVGVQGLLFAVSVGGVVRGARVQDATLFRIGHRLAEAGRAERVAYDAALGYGNQFFAYRFWSGADWEVVSSGDLLASGADWVVTRRRLPLPLLEQERNGVKLYRGKTDVSRLGGRRVVPSRPSVAGWRGETGAGAR